MTEPSVIEQLLVRCRIFQTTIGGGQWAWMLWRPMGSGQAIIACQNGYATRREAKRGWRNFRRMVRDAVVVVELEADGKEGLV